MKFVRLFFLGLALAPFALRASDAIPAPKDGVSNQVSQPHVTAELISQAVTGDAGAPFLVALHLHMDKDWHTYWINPGDAGLATTIKWTLPEGFTAGPIQWPTPEKHAMGPLTTYGYGGDVYLLTTITLPEHMLRTPEFYLIKAHADWLVCQEECIPGKADLEVKLAAGSGKGANGDPAREKFFAQVKARLPVENTRWNVSAWYGQEADFNSLNGPPSVNMQLKGKAKAFAVTPKLRFYPETENVLGNDEKSQGRTQSSGSDDSLEFSVHLQQNGDKPDHLSGVLVSDQPLVGDAKAVYLASFPVAAGQAAAAGRPALGVAAAVPSDGSAQPSSAGASSTPAVAADSASGVAAAVPSGGSAQPNSAIASSPPDAVANSSTARSAAATSIAQPFLIAVLGAAFLGGLILNLMPCVLPVLSLKSFFVDEACGRRPTRRVEAGSRIHPRRGPFFLDSRRIAHCAARGGESSRLGIPDAVAGVRPRADFFIFSARLEFVWRL